MTPEEVDRNINFLLNHQAQLAVNVDRLSTTVGQLTTTVDQLAGEVTDLVSIVKTDHSDVRALIAELAEIVRLQSRRLDRCEKSIEDHEERIKRQE
jgi:hypothetical protein